MRKLVFCLVSLVLLSSCSSKAELSYSGAGWALTVAGTDVDYDLSDKDAICQQYTNTTANLWVGDNLVIIECPSFTAVQYITEKSTYEIVGDNTGCAIDGLSQLMDRTVAEQLMETEPYTYAAHTDVDDAGDDGWGTRTVEGRELPWPSDCTSTASGWSDNDTTFQITPYTTMEDATEDLEAMKQSIVANQIEGFKMWYYESGPYQGLAWLLDNEYYISLAKYDATGSIYLTLAGQDTTAKARDIAEIYGLGDALSAMFDSVPIFEQ